MGFSYFGVKQINKLYSSEYKDRVGKQYPDGIRLNEDGTLDVLEVKYRRDQRTTDKHVTGTIDEKFQTTDYKIWFIEKMTGRTVNTFTYVTNSHFNEDKFLFVKEYYKDHPKVRFVVKEVR